MQRARIVIILGALVVSTALPHPVFGAAAQLAGALFRLEAGQS